MEISELLDFASRTGAMLLESGAETRRVEDTLSRIIGHFYGGYSETFVMLTGFFVNIGSHTKIVRAERRITNLDKIAKINMLSRDIVAGKTDFDGAVKRIDAISRERPYPLCVKTAAVSVCCAFFTLLYGGGIYDGINSLITGAGLNLFIEYLRRHRAANFIVTFLGGAELSFSIMLLARIGLGDSRNSMIAGTIIPLVPGLATTNALRDIIGGDYISGGARLFDAVVSAVALAAGAALVMYLSGRLGAAL